MVSSSELLATPKIISPFTKEFLQSGERLSASEIRTATQIVSEGDQRLANFDTEIYRVRAELGRLVLARDNTQEQVTLHKRAIHSSRHFPAAILSKVFPYTLPLMDPDEPGPTPWYLGHICRYWREVALTLPILWSDIFIFSARKFSIERLETLLSRSINSPLKVLLWSSSDDPHVNVLLHILVANSVRWRAASLLLTPYSFPELVPLRGRIPILRHLRINVVDHNKPSSTSDTSNPFEIAPDLRDVSFEDLSGLRFPIVLPWNQLTRWKTESRVPNPYTILPITSNLEIASLAVNRVPQQAIFLPRLRRLYITLLPALDHFVLPALEEIYLVDADPTPVLSVLSRSSAKLKTLHIIFCNPTHISTILEACPTLTAFGVQIGPRDESKSLLADLTVRQQGTMSICLGPNVEFIAFGIDQGKLNQGVFLKMVVSRWRVAPGGPCCRLRKVELFIVSGVTLGEHTLKRLKALEAEGLQMSILTGMTAQDRLLDWRV
jgi:hypothetical protein